ncbi:MAG: hypothetical protein IJ702_02540, partial [Fretibacterium sp.]|nr:hypothetical protein [Fretibacterium sp.]
MKKHMLVFLTALLALALSAGSALGATVEISVAEGQAIVPATSIEKVGVELAKITVNTEGLTGTTTAMDPSDWTNKKPTTSLVNASNAIEVVATGATASDKLVFSGATANAIKLSLVSDGTNATSGVDPTGLTIAGTDYYVELKDGSNYHHLLVKLKKPAVGDIGLDIKTGSTPVAAESLDVDVPTTKKLADTTLDPVPGGAKVTSTADVTVLKKTSEVAADALAGTIEVSAD